MKWLQLSNVSFLIVVTLLTTNVLAQQGGGRGGRRAQGTQTFRGQKAENQQGIRYGEEFQNRQPQSQGQEDRRGYGQRRSGNMTAGQLSANQVQNLIHMREEEKLARDVYTVLGKTSQLAVFRNIAVAESRHMQSVARVLARYDIHDPVVDDAPGAFTDPNFTKLYQSLVDVGSRSPLDAVMVGAKIEEMDIADLRKSLDGSTPADIRVVFENLERGSRNHLRAFASEIADRGAVYQAEYLTPAEFDRIASSRLERGGRGTQETRGAGAQGGRGGAGGGRRGRR